MPTYFVVCSDTVVLQIIQWFIIATALASCIGIGITGRNTLKTKSFPFTYKYMFYACNVLGVIQMLLFSATISICHSNIFNREKWSYFIAVVSFVIYALIILHLCVSWLSKLYLTFNRSTYAKSGKFYIAISVIFIFIILFGMTGIILYNLNDWIGVIFITMSGFLYFGVSIFIVQAFQRQLLKLITARIVTIRCKSKATLREKSNSIDLSFKDQKLVHCMAKYFVLGITSFSTTLLVLIAMLFQLLNVYNIKSGSESLSNIIFNVLQILIVIDITSNVLCLFLQFEFADETYMKLCGYFDAKTHNKIEEKATLKLRGDTFAFYANKFAPTVHKESTRELDINIETMDKIAEMTEEPQKSDPNKKRISMDFDQLIDFNKLNRNEIHQQIERKSSERKLKNSTKDHTNINPLNRVMSDSTASSIETICENSQQVSTVALK